LRLAAMPHVHKLWFNTIFFSEYHFSLINLVGRIRHNNMTLENDEQRELGELGPAGKNGRNCFSISISFNISPYYFW
jgi:hypothetical protein